MIRIGFTLIGGTAWTGGYNYLTNLLRVITTHHAEALAPVLFLGTDIEPSIEQPLRAIAGVVIVKSQTMNASRRSRALLLSVVLGADPAVRQLFRKHDIQAVFETAQFHGAHLGIPAIAWMTDFQHRELPQRFSRFAWWKRELGFRAQIAAKRVVMLSSEDSRSVCEKHYPATIGRTRVVRFAVIPGRQPDADAVRAVREIYGLPERYIYLPNQFWLHKNHLLVVEALALLKQAGHSVVVAASGKQIDPHEPKHFLHITKQLQAKGLIDHFRLLGLIPYEHVGPLMVGSVAVLNPSLFEGWSTTVEEARALSVPMVLSDIPVHKEQASELARFFDRSSAASLAEALLSVWQSSVVATAPQPALANGSSAAVQRFAEDFLAVVRHAAAVS